MVVGRLTLLLSMVYTHKPEMKRDKLTGDITLGWGSLQGRLGCDKEYAKSSMHHKRSGLNLLTKDIMLGTGETGIWLKHTKLV